MVRQSRACGGAVVADYEQPIRRALIYPRPRLQAPFEHAVCIPFVVQCRRNILTTSLVVSGGSFVVSGGAAVPTTAIKTAISTLRCPSGAITPSSDTTFEKEGFEGTCAARERGAGAAPHRSSVARDTHALLGPCAGQLTVWQFKQ